MYSRVCNAQFEFAGFDLIDTLYKTSGYPFSEMKGDVGMADYEKQSEQVVAYTPIPTSFVFSNATFNPL